MRHNKSEEDVAVDSIQPKPTSCLCCKVLSNLKAQVMEGQYEATIPTARDRIVQASLKLVLEPIFEADFKPSSYGFRPRRRPHDAIAEIHMFASQGYTWVLEGDITACFDEIDHTALMDRLRHRIGDKHILSTVKALLHSGILSEDGVIRETKSGTPQGGILTPQTQ